MSKISDLSLMPCTSIKGVGKSMAERLERLGIFCVQDLLFHLPARYQDRTQVMALSNLAYGEHAVVEGIIEAVQLPKTGGKTKLLCRLRDGTGYIHLRFFYVNALQLKTLIVGTRVRCFAEVRRGVDSLEMIHPEYRIINPSDTIMYEENLTPIYPMTEGLSQLMMRKLTDQALELLRAGGVLQDILPSSLLEQFAFPTLSDALQFVHRPPKDAPVDLLLSGQHITQKRLVFEELLAHRLSLLQLKKTFQIEAAFSLNQCSKTLIQKFLSLLPFQLTAAQQRVTAEIAADLAKPHPMLRLVQGDVGSGKTVVAALAMLHVIQNGYQVAMLAPTELLAEQHMKNLTRWFEPLNISVAFLSGQLKSSERRSSLQAISGGSAHVIVGTHALFQKGVEFKKLALIIVDEQHRFGVEQRASLRQKGVKDQCLPHQLIMTATPIPRTLAMSAYADLDYSVIDELPPGRTPITTIVVANSRRQEILQRIHEACVAGKQVYWVCTLIEESENLQCQAAENAAAELHLILPNITIGLIHGRMKAAEKEAVMSGFKQGEIQLLVATTVIEVGVDVPNASLMVIENAERLGLAQLHQLRGRIGRGAVKSHCVLLYQFPLSALAKQRLNIMRETNDGFKIAEHDLKIRGPGEILGTKQTGDITLRIADLIRDEDLFPAVTAAAAQLEKDHPTLIPILMRRWITSNEQYRRV